jgi:hypothetical protein
MTLVENTPHPSHIGELRLRRFRLGELPAGEQDEIVRHTTDCGPCRARLKTIEDEQRHFERELSFERFAGGVERARRVPRVYPRRAWTVAAVGFAAAAALVVVVRPAAREDAADAHGWNRIKGSASALLRIRGADGRTQRSIDAGRSEALRPGEQVLLGYKSPEAAHLVAVSIDEAGAVTPLYPAAGAALPVEARPDLRYMPDSLEFTGHGRERVFLLLSERPLAVDEVTRAVRDAHARAGDLGALASVPVEGHGKVTQFTWLLQKP